MHLSSLDAYRAAKRDALSLSRPSFFNDHSKSWYISTSMGKASSALLSVYILSSDKFEGAIQGF
jgi:hypothetical protein